MQKILQNIEEKIGIPQLVNQMVEKLSHSEINSLLLALFQRSIEKVTPASLLQQFSQNRFCGPSVVHPVDFMKLEIDWLSQAERSGFTPITLSPLAPLGTCSVIAQVDQNNVISALRGTEVVADATNVLALQIAEDFKQNRKVTVKKYAATHRHVRGQFFNNPAFTAHFGVFCLVTGSIDRGNFLFETEQLMDHLNMHLALLSKVFDKEKLLVELYLKEENTDFQIKLQESLEALPTVQPPAISLQPESTAYYQLLQFKIFIQWKGNKINLSDGGLVDWTQQLLQNKKQRLFISGIGLELVYKIRNGLL